MVFKVLGFGFVLGTQAITIAVQFLMMLSSTYIRFCVISKTNI